MRKRILAITLAIGMMMSLAACGNNTVTEADTTEAATEAVTEAVSGSGQTDEVVAEPLKGSESDYVLSGKVTDATMNTVQITTDNGAVVDFSLNDDTKKTFKNGLLLDITVAVGFNGELSGNDSSNCTVVFVTEEDASITD